MATGLVGGDEGEGYSPVVAEPVLTSVATGRNTEFTEEQRIRLQKKFQQLKKKFQPIKKKVNSTAKKSVSRVGHSGGLNPSHCAVHDPSA